MQFWKGRAMWVRKYVYRHPGDQIGKESEQQGFKMARRWQAGIVFTNWLPTDIMMDAFKTLLHEVQCSCEVWIPTCHSLAVAGAVSWLRCYMYTCTLPWCCSLGELCWWQPSSTQLISGSLQFRMAGYKLTCEQCRIENVHIGTRMARTQNGKELRTMRSSERPKQRSSWNIHTIRDDKVGEG